MKEKLKQYIEELKEIRTVLQENRPKLSTSRIRDNAYLDCLNSVIENLTNIAEENED